MKKTSERLRKLSLDGEEPILSSSPSNTDIIKAYNWYSNNCDDSDALSYVITFLKSKKASKDQIKKVQKLNPFHLRNIAWNCRILTNGGNLPNDIIKTSMNKLASMIDSVSLIEDTPQTTTVKHVTIQDRLKEHVGDVIASIEAELDSFYLNGTSDFSPSDFMSKYGIKPMVAKKIMDYYQPLYSEVYDALHGNDEDLKYAYKRWKKPSLKRYCEFLKNILSACEVASIVDKKPRRARKKKEKPASVLVSKLKYKEKTDGGDICSVSPVAIVGAYQLWTYNTSNRNLTVYTAISPTGLSVKGSTITGFDEKTSVSKKLRKPDQVLPRVLEGGKIVLRKLMDDIRCVAKKSSGRINNETILLRIIK